MDPKDYCRIKSHCIPLKGCLTEIVDKVIEDFVRNDILNAKQKKRINQKKTNEEKSEALLNRMLGQGNLYNKDKIYQVLCGRLDKENLGHVKQMLEDTVMPERPVGDKSGDKLEEDTETDAPERPVGDGSGDKLEEDTETDAPERPVGDGSGDKLEEDTETDAPAQAVGDRSGDKCEKDVQMYAQVGNKSGDKCEEDQKAGAKAAGNIENSQIHNTGNTYTHCGDIIIGPSIVHNFHK